MAPLVEELLCQVVTVHVEACPPESQDNNVTRLLVGQEEKVAKS